MINYIEIKNFKSIKEVKLNLNPINILIGANGVGKSNFISFFKFLTEIHNQSLQKYFVQNDIDSIFHYGRRISDYIYGKLFFDNDINSYYFTIKPDEQNGVYIEKEASGFQSHRNNDLLGYTYESNLKESFIPKSERYRNKYLSKYLKGLQIFHFHDTSNVSNLRKECDIEDNAYLKYDGRNLPAFLYYLKEKEPISFKRIEKTIQSIAPFFKEFVLNPSRINEGKINLRWRHTDDSESNFSVFQLSDGTLRFIALTTLLLQTNPPEVIIIDEPELGLHPFAVNKLAGFIKSVSAKSQVIISTQSPQLISNFVPEDIIVSEMVNKQTLMYRLNEADLVNWLEDYTLGDIWEYNKISFGQPFK